MNCVLNADILKLHTIVVFCYLYINTNTTEPCIRDCERNVSDSGCDVQAGRLDYMLLHSAGRDADYVLSDRAHAGQTTPESGRKSAAAYGRTVWQQLAVSGAVIG